MSHPDSPSGQPYSGPPFVPDPSAREAGGWRVATERRESGRRLRTNTILTALALAVSTLSLVILIFFTVRYFQIEHAVKQFGDELGKTFSTSDTSPSPGGVPTDQIPGTDEFCAIHPDNPAC